MLWDLDSMMNASVVITHRTPGIDANGEREMTVSGATATAAHLAPQTSTEDVGGETITVGQWLLVVPAGVTIGAHDLVECDGRTYGVVGAGRKFRNPGDPSDHHTEATLVEVAG